MKRTELRRKTPMRAASMNTSKRVPAPPKVWPRRAAAIKATGKRLRQSRSTPKATPVQLVRWAAMRKVGCIACLLNDIDHDLARVPRCDNRKPHSGNQEIHHLTRGGRRRGHDVSICLCRYHHTGDHLPQIDRGYMAQALIYGPSFGKGRSSFEAIYGSDDGLLAYQNHVLTMAVSE